MATWITGGVPAEPIALAQSETETPTEGKVTLRCAWADRHDVVENIFVNNLIWPYWPESNWLPKTFSIKAAPNIRTVTGGPAEMNTYTHADIELTFGPPGGSTGNAPGIGSPGGESDIEAIYYETYQPSGEMLKLPPMLPGKWQFRWGAIKSNSDPLTNEEAPTRLIIGLDYIIRWVGLETVPTAFFDAVDHVNSLDITTSAGKTFAPETLLCQSPVISRTVTTAAAEPLWEVEARFSYRKDGWNKFWSPQHAAFREIYLFKPFDEATGEVYKNFPLYDFTAMLP